MSKPQPDTVQQPPSFLSWTILGGNSHIEKQPLLPADGGRVKEDLQDEDLPGPIEIQLLNEPIQIQPAHSSALSKQQLLPPKLLLYGGINLVAAVFTILGNKLVMERYGFQFPTLLTWVQCLVALVVVKLAAWLGLFDVKQLTWSEAFPSAASFLLFAVAGNNSLKCNPLWFYQIFKVLVIPASLILEAQLQKRKFRSRVLLAVVLMLIGLIVAVSTDPQERSNLRGMLSAVAAAVGSALYHAFGRRTADLGVTAVQLLHQSLGATVLMLTALVPVLDNMGFTDATSSTVLGFEYNTPSITGILLSCLPAVGVVLSVSLVVRESPSPALQYNVGGHLKTVVLLLVAATLFGESLGAGKLVGSALALTAVLWYGYVRFSELQG